MSATEDLLQSLRDEDEAAVATALAAGASLIEADDQGLLPLHFASINHLLPIMKQLLDHGADPNVPDGDELTSVDLALKGGRVLGAKVAALRVLLAGGGRLDGVDEDGDTKLHGFCRSRENGTEADARALVELFVQHGSDPNAKNKKQETALHLAVQAKFERLVPALIAAGADLEARDWRSETPLHRSVPGNMAIARRLIASGARLDAEDRRGKLPFDRANSDEWEALLCPPGRQTKKQILAEWTARIEASPNDATLYIERGNVLVGQSERGAAAADYRRAAEIDPQDKRAHHNLGVVLSQLGAEEHEGAVAAFSRVLEIDGNELEARLARVSLYDSLGRFNEVLVDCAALQTLPLDDDQQQAVAELEQTAHQEQQFASMTPIAITESWYGVTLPREYREFLEQEQYKQYPRHRPGQLPNYRTTPRAIFIVGRDLFGEPAGKAHFRPSLVKQSAEMLQSEADVGKDHSVGDHVKQEAFSGLEFENFEAGELEKLIPFATFGDSQALAIDISQGDLCPVKMWEHEAGKFLDVTDSIAEFLSAMEPMPDDDDDEDDDDEDEDDDEE